MLYQRSEEAGYTLHLLTFAHGVVVVEEHGVRVGLVSILEGKWYVVGAENLIEQTLSRGAVVVEGFVDNVPCVYSAAEMMYHGIYMLAYAFFQDLWRHEVALLVVVEPGCTLGMPDETMAHHLETCVTCFVNELIGKGEVIDSLLRMDDLTLHAVLGYDPVEILSYHRPVGCLIIVYLSCYVVTISSNGVGFHLPLVHAHTRIPKVAIGIL